MLEDIIDAATNKNTYKFYLCLAIVILIIISPFQSIKKAYQYHQNYYEYLQQLSNGPSDESSQLPLSQMFRLLSRNPFRGRWESSLVRSKFLQQEEGLIEMRTLKKQGHQVQLYDFFIRIYDGKYRENSYYDINLEGTSLIVKQRYQSGKIIYDAVSPLIGYYRKGYIFQFNTQQSIYINKLKLKITCTYKNDDEFSSQPSGMSIQFLLASQYSINLIAKDIKQYQQTFHDILFAVLLTAIISVQFVGIFNIYQNIFNQREYRERFSIFGIMSAAGLDFLIAIVLSRFCSQSEKKFAVYSIPTFMFWFKIVIIDLRILIHIISYRNDDSVCKANFQIYIFFGLLTFFAYICNLNGLFFMVVSNLIIFPQIWRNYIIGHKLKSNLTSYFMIALPRYMLILYLRIYKYNAFDLKSNIGICTACIFFILFQASLIMAQMKYGVRAILPKFIHPVEFEYFTSNKEDSESTCSICIFSLKQKSPEQLGESSLDLQEFYNKIVQTPCHHKFHSQCLARWMETKLQCPNCRRILPPINQYQ